MTGRPRLTRGDFVLEVAPEVGGAIAAFRFAGTDLLRPLPADSADPLQAASFVLAPFANRVAGAAFTFEGREIRMQPDLVGAPHGLHGHGWRGAWAVEDIVADRIELSFLHGQREGGWPWAYRARQSLQLTDDGLRMEVELENLSAEPMPAGTGFHPYFPIRGRARVTAQTAGVWLTDAGQIPTVLVAADHFGPLRQGLELPGSSTIDHCYAGWTGSAAIELGDGTALRLEASDPLRWLHLYSPAAGGAFCVEPVSQMPDAFNQAGSRDETGVRVLQPGERLQASATVTLERPPSG